MAAPGRATVASPREAGSSRRRVEHGASAGGRCASRCCSVAGALAQDRAAAGRARRRRRCDRRRRRRAPGRVRARGAGVRRGPGRRGDGRVRDLGRPRGAQRRHVLTECATAPGSTSRCSPARTRRAPPSSPCAAGSAGRRATCSWSTSVAARWSSPSGPDEDPDFAVSLPLGAGRLTRDSCSGDPPRRRGRQGDAQARARRARPDGRRMARRWRGATRWRRRRRSSSWPGSPAPRPRARAVRTPRLLARGRLTGWVPRLAATMSRAERGDLPASRSAGRRQLPAAALVAEAAMDLLDVEVARGVPVGAARGRDPALPRPA